MARKSIYDTQEYKLSSQENQGWAFTHKDQYTDAVTAAKKQGVKVEGRVAKVVTNTGETIEVPIVATMYDIKPSDKFPVKFFTLPGDKMQSSIFMVKGSSPKNKTAVYFSNKSFNASPEVIALKKEIGDAVDKFHHEHHESVKGELLKRLPPVAKEALKDLPEVIDKSAKGEEASNVMKWFTKKGFTISHGIDEKDFQHVVNSYHRTGHIPSDFIKSTQDRWGHQDGTSVKIDFANKSIHAYGWSSDD